MKKRDNIIRTATRLFAEQGFAATTTIQIASEANVTEPLLYYHFEGKDELFTHIVQRAFDRYLSCLDRLDGKDTTSFGRIEGLISACFQMVDDIPLESYLLSRTCPSRLKDPEKICVTCIVKRRKWLETYIRNALKTGVDSGEFVSVPLKATVNLLIATLNGIIRQFCIGNESTRGMKQTTTDFFRRSLLAR